MNLTRSLIQVTLLLSVPGLVSCAGDQSARKTSPPTGPVGPSVAWDDDRAARAAIQRAVDAVYPALVRVHVVSEEGLAGRMRKLRATGSGVIISEEGHLLTNHHVAGRGTRIVCRLADGEEVDAALVGTDALSDLAVLKLDLTSRRDPKAPLAVARFGDSDRLKIGDTVLAMGSPAGLSQSVTKGVVANTAMISPKNLGSMILDGEKVGELVRWIGHDATIFFGNSGGPLVNLNGEIVGVNELLIGSMAGAIPSNLARAVARELIAKGRVARSWIGLEPQPLLKKTARTQGVLVAAVLPDSPAAKAGILPGDLITDYNDAPVMEIRADEDIPVFNRMVLTTPVGSKLALKGLRNGKLMSWRLTTLEREPNQAREIELQNWGLTVRDFTRVSALENLREDQRGVLVDTVRPGGPCAEAKPPLRDNDVITKVGGIEIAGVASLIRFTRDFVQNLEAPEPVVVTFERESQNLMTVVDIGPESRADQPMRPAKAWLGVETQVLTRELAEVLGVGGKRGVRVTQVLPRSPAEQAGIQTGDIFLKLDGQVIPASTLSDEELFDNLIRQYKVGGEAELEGVRGRQPLKVVVQLGRRPKAGSELEEYKDDQFEFRARDLSLSDRLEAKLPDDVEGVRILTVENAGWAALAGLSSGDIVMSVDGRPVDSTATLRGVMSELHESKPRRVVFFVKRGIHTRFIEIEPKW